MMDVVPKLSYVVSHYDSNILRANVKFSAIEKIMQSMKKYPSIIFYGSIPETKSFPDKISGETGLLLW